MNHHSRPISLVSSERSPEAWEATGNGALSRYTPACPRANGTRAARLTLPGVLCRGTFPLPYLKTELKNRGGGRLGWEGSAKRAERTSYNAALRTKGGEGERSERIWSFCRPSIVIGKRGVLDRTRLNRNRRRGILPDQNQEKGAESFIPPG